MYKCWNCGWKFDEPDYVEYYAEDFYGVGSMFPDKHTITIAECPSCGSGDIWEIDEEDPDEYE
jgi:predicted RNA-binding Zn-ribbon protein involved in translation (DUF1610 family)